MALQTGQLITELIDQLKQHPEVAQWSVLHEQRREWQHYLIQTRPEATREVMQELYQVTLYHSHPHPTEGGNAMGTATITLTEADLPNLRTKIEEGLLAASLTNNEPWSLPQQSKFPDVLLVDEATLADPFAKLEHLTADLFRAVDQQVAVRLSAAEMFFEEIITRIYNQAGVSGEQRETSFMLEVVLLAQDGDGEEMEHWFVERRRRLQDLDIAELIAENAQYARDSIVAELPKTWQGPVVIAHGELPDMFSPLTSRVSGSLKYMKLTQVAPGEPFFGDQQVEGDPLDASYSSALPYGVKSFSFSAEGLPGRDITVVKDNVFRSYLASQRYADYLGVEATGEAGNLVLQPGSTPVAELLRGPVYYIVAFSAMMPNTFTGDFAVEIKLGYYIDEHGNRTPVKGGSVSGNLFDMLTHAKYAQEEVFSGAYKGPVAVRVENRLTIAGE
ncbi:metallopeptidase TldD-related protein [Tumebacillus permanentifrigoris]|uniref:Putative Zn-dependent protease n=1 Tax=Tumebacillus permanentifrigoris TaxID=378543 RepID=A0A316D8G4_9BACL|nr:metallopeptidase TldD-related protein [Tumebacillus permanentifrigoris]PWK11213.1 putative Zn-dependent protease [Tumebacillus permanentifrigoris]